MSGTTGRGKWLPCVSGLAWVMPTACSMRFVCHRTVLRRLGIAVAALLVLAMMEGCHKRTSVSHRSTPPPPPARRSGGSTTARRAPPRTSAPTKPPADDNVPAFGKASSVEIGMASWYAPNGRRSANGDIYDGNSLTAAHRTLPLGTTIRVTNLSTNQSATVRVTDRGPFVRGRVLDLSTAAAKLTGVYRMGVAQVRIEVMAERPDVSPVGRWCVQIGAFVQEEHALQLRDDLLRRYSSGSKVIEFPGATGYWVRINPVQSDRAHALSIAQTVRVAEPEAQAYLVRLD